MELNQKAIEEGAARMVAQALLNDAATRRSVVHQTASKVWADVTDDAASIRKDALDAVKAKVDEIVADRLDSLEASIDKTVEVEGARLAGRVRKTVDDKIHNMGARFTDDVVQRALVKAFREAHGAQIAEVAAKSFEHAMSAMRGDEKKTDEYDAIRQTLIDYGFGRCTSLAEGVHMLAVAYRSMVVSAQAAENGDAKPASRCEKCGSVLGPRVGLIAKCENDACGALHVGKGSTMSPAQPIEKSECGTLTMSPSELDLIGQALRAMRNEYSGTDFMPPDREDEVTALLDRLGLGAE